MFSLLFSVLAVRTIAHFLKFIEFIGKASHAGNSPEKGINALNAANIAMNAINSQRETFKDEDHIRVHPIITKGGNVVSAVPDIVKIETFVRGASIESIMDANEKVDNCLKAGALATGCKLKIVTIPGYLPIKNNQELQNLYISNLKNNYDEKVHRYWFCWRWFYYTISYSVTDWSKRL